MKMHLDRRWGNGLTTAVFIMALAGALTAFAATPYSEVTATAVDDVTMATEVTVVATPANVAPNPGADGNRILMGANNAMTHDSAFTGATGLLFTEFTTANMGGSTDAGFSISTSVVDSVPTAPSLLLTFTSDENPLANMGGANDGGTNHPVGNNFGHTP